MGAYGAVIAAGGGLTQTSIDYSWGTPHGLLGDYKSGSKSHLDLMNDRIKTVIAIAPWGMNLLWSTKFGHKLRGCSQTLPLPWWALAHH